MIKKSVISLISYDAHYLPKSIEKYYNYVDEIVLGLDKNRTTWSKNPSRLMRMLYGVNLVRLTEMAKYLL